MKKGDKIICIKTRTGVTENLNTKGETYEITEIGGNKIITTCNKNVCHLRCHFLLSGKPKESYIFSEFFTSIKEMRLKKLKNLKFEKY